MCNKLSMKNAGRHFVKKCPFLQCTETTGTPCIICRAFFVLFKLTTSLTERLIIKQPDDGYHTSSKWHNQWMPEIQVKNRDNAKLLFFPSLVTWRNLINMTHWTVIKKPSTSIITKKK